MSRILVTGSEGFIGRRLVRRLQTDNHADNHRIFPFSRSLGHDLLSPDALTPFENQGIETVIHLASRSFVPDSWKDPQGFMRINAEGTQHTVDFCLRTKARLLHVSSYVYGPPRYLPVDEAHPLAAFNPYAESKIESERRVMVAIAERGLQATIIRPFNIFGPGQDRRFLIAQILNDWRDKGEVIVENFAPRRDYLFVDDMIDALYVLLTRPSNGEIHNIGAGHSFSVAEVIDALERVTGRSVPRHARGTERPNDVPDVVASCRLTREGVWQPKRTLDEGLAACLEETKTLEFQI